MTCPFCERVRAGDIDTENALAVAFPDAYPVSDGHMLVASKRHESSFLHLSSDEQSDIVKLAIRIATELDADGVNVGINIGEAAGQTVDHAHVHVIPRTTDDVPDARGGVRRVVPDRAVYWDNP